jgi:hypothetical protein
MTEKIEEKYEIEIDHSENLSNFLKQYLNNKKNSDISFFMNDKKIIFGHKIIIASRRY